MAGDFFSNAFSGSLASKQTTPELDAAWRLFNHISERDPGAVATKEDAIAAFKECLATVRSPRDPADDDDVPF